MSEWASSKEALQCVGCVSNGDPMCYSCSLLDALNSQLYHTNLYNTWSRYMANGPIICFAYWAWNDVGQLSNHQ